ncbi:MAG TPA: tetratricopeptide repeat protein [Gemmatimonadota bacterium]|nr:tetratricopeptide repeat protein [Gemmatimonadota bacterium]
MRPQRSIATVLFTDIVASTEKAAVHGDLRWQEILRQHHHFVRERLRHYGGREVATAGDGFLAVFDSPARALACAAEIRDAVRDMGLDVRCGLHLGEVERSDGAVGGIAVHIGARVAALAQPGEVLVSATVRDAEIGSGFGFEGRGEHELKGVPGAWRLYALTTVPEELAGEAREPRPAGRRWERILGRPTGRREPLLGAAIALALLFGAAGVYVMIRDRGRSLAPPEAVAGAAAPGVAVLPFEVSSPGLDEWREGMVTLLSTTLDGAGDLRGIDSRTLLAQWDRQVPEGQRADTETALRVARTTGARYALLGSAVAIGPNLRLLAEVYNVENGARLGTGQVEGTPDSVFALVDGLAREILEVILEKGEGEVPRVNLAALTTTSIPALKAFLEGEALFRRGEVAPARELYEIAVEADSTFALAWNRVATTIGWTEPGPLVVEARLKALRHADRLPERERLLVEGELFLNLGFSEGAERMREVTRRYPDDAEAWFLLADIYYHHTSALATLEEAEQTALRAVELDPSFAPYRFHPTEFAFMSPPDSARAARRVAELLVASPEGMNARAGAVALELAFGDSTRRDALLDSLPSTDLDLSTVFNYLYDPGFWEIYERLALDHAAEGGRQVPHALFWGNLTRRGRLADALSYLDEEGPPWFPACLLVSATSLDVPIPEAVLDEHLALRASDSTPSARTGCGAIYSIDRGRRDDYLRSLAIHRRERERLVAEGDTLEARFEDGMIRSMEGYARWKGGDPAGALPILQEAARTYPFDALAVWMGKIHLDQGRPEEAVRHFRALKNNPLADYYLGLAYEAAGELGKAGEAYSSLVGFWRDADPELQPMVEEARQGLARVRGVRRE